MERRFDIRTALTTVLAGAVLVGCSSSDGGSGQNDGGSTSASSGYVSPLDEFLNPGKGGDEDYLAKDKDVQERIAACMSEQGFDYIPFVYPASGGGKDDVFAGSGTREWAEKYGYGTSTLGGLVTETSSEPVDPNQPIIEAMGDAERQAYLEALYGTASGFGYEPGGGVAVAGSASATSAASSSSDAATTAGDPAAETTSSTGDPAVTVPDGDPGMAKTMSMPPLADQGCWGQAQAAVYGDQSATGDAGQDEFQDMWDAYSQMFGQLEADPQVVAAQQLWIDCMADGGHPGFTTVWEPGEQVYERWSELNGMPTEPDENGMMVAPSTMPEPAADKVAEFQQYEIALAVADWDCRASSHYTELLDGLRTEKERQFVEEHRAELERYRDVLNGGN